MVIKRGEVVEITPDLWEKKKKTRTKRRKTLSKEEEEEEGTPLRGIFCLKKREDMKIFEEKEDCFILDFDPNDSFDARKLSSFSDVPDGDNDVAIIHEKGQVACRDFPHPRHLCSKFPFGSTQHTTHCNQCYCYVCDVAAPCADWTAGLTSHCEAFEDKRWKPLRELYRNIDAARLKLGQTRIYKVGHSNVAVDYNNLTNENLAVDEIRREVRNRRRRRRTGKGETANVDNTPIIGTSRKNSSGDFAESSRVLAKYLSKYHY